MINVLKLAFLFLTQEIYSSPFSSTDDGEDEATPYWNTLIPQFMVLDIDKIVFPEKPLSMDFAVLLDF